MNGWIDIVTAVWDFLRQFFPIHFVDDGYQGVLYRTGVIQAHREPGWHFVWPLIEELEHVATNIKTRETHVQDVEGIAVSMAVEWEIRRADLLMLKVEGEEQEEAILNVCRASLSRRLLEGDEELELDEAFEVAVRDEANRRTWGWGVNVRRVSIMDYMDSATAIRLIGQ